MVYSQLANAFLSKIENLVNAMKVEKNHIFVRKTFLFFSRKKGFENMISLSKISRSVFTAVISAAAAAHSWGLFSRAIPTLYNRTALRLESTASPWSYTFWRMAFKAQFIPVLSDVVVLRFNFGSIIDKRDNRWQDLSR